MVSSLVGGEIEILNLPLIMKMVNNEENIELGMKMVDHLLAGHIIMMGRVVNVPCNIKNSLLFL